MPEDWTETLRHFALEGRLSLPWLVVLGLVAAAIIVWFGLRESRLATRPRVCWYLMELRLITLLLVLWALAEPTDVITKKRHQPKTVGIFLDASASMSIQDTGDGSGDLTKWQEANDVANRDENARLSLDAARGALAAARRNYLALGKQLRQLEARRPSEGDAAKKAVETGRKLLRELNREELRMSAASAQAFSELLETLDDEVLPSAVKLEGNKAIRLLITERERLLQSLDLQLGTALDTLSVIADHAYALVESQHSGTGRARSISRLERALAFLESAEENWLEALGDNVRIERYRFDQETIPIERSDWRKGVPETGADPLKGTDLSSWLRQASRQASAGELHAALVISDGVHNTGPSPRDLAPGLQNVATVVVPIGDTRLRRDVFLHHVKVPPSVMKKDTLLVECMVTAHDCVGEELVVELMEENRVLDRQTLRVNEVMEDHRLTLEWQADEVGQKDFELRVLPVDDEFSQENNVDFLKVSVIDDELRILLADNLPRWEFRYLKSILERDPRVKVDSVLYEPAHVYAGRRDPTAPQTDLPGRLEDWSRYRLVILGDLTASQLGPVQQVLLRQYVVEAGGNVIFIAGDHMPGDFLNTPVGDLIPVDRRAGNVSPAGYQLRVTAEGETAPPVLVAGGQMESRKVWETLSERLPVYDLSPYSIPTPTTHVLIAASDRQRDQNRAFLSWHYVGKGRAVYLAAPVAYQLRYRKGDTYHHRFWGQLFRWAIARDLAGGSKTVKLSTDKTRYPFRSNIDVQLRLQELNGLPVAGAENELVVRQEDKPIQNIRFRPEPGVPGMYRADLAELPPGKITLEARGPAIDRLLEEEAYTDPIVHEISIDPHDSAELRTPLADTALLRAIADGAQGAFLSPGAVREAFRHLDLAPVTSEVVNREPLWNRWLLIWLILALLLAEWIGRKWVGLV